MVFPQLTFSKGNVVAVGEVHYPLGFKIHCTAGHRILYGMSKICNCSACSPKRFHELTNENEVIPWVFGMLLTVNTKEKKIKFPCHSPCVTSLDGLYIAHMSENVGHSKHYMKSRCLQYLFMCGWPHSTIPFN